MKKTFLNLLAAEAFGTFCLIFTGCGAIASHDLNPGNIGHVGICLVFGMVVLAMIYSVGNISGAHLNPAVTIGFVAAGRMKLADTGPYFIGQLAGGMAAALLLALFFPGHANLGATLPHMGGLRSFTMEAVISFILMFVILNVSIGHMEKGIMAGVAVGGTIALLAIFAGPLTGASMNPMRSLAPAMASGTFEGLWIYLTAPFVGTISAMTTCRMVQGRDCCSKVCAAAKNQKD